MIPAEFESWLLDPNRRPLVMGVLNVTPDSFSDGGRYSTFDAAVAHADEMLDAGADLIDIGGESTRPGSQRVSSLNQIDRVVPIIESISKHSSNRIMISIDTTLATVAKASLDAGATLINDISAGTDDCDGDCDATGQMFALAAARRAPIVLMHMLGSPLSMQDQPTYPDDDVVSAVERYLSNRLSAARDCGISDHRILFDPGIGFGKTIAHNLALLRETNRLAALGRPLVIGASRKRFIGTITGESEPSHRLFGTAAAVAYSVANGASIVRVHDVKPMTQVVRLVRAIQSGDVEPTSD